MFETLCAHAGCGNEDGAPLVAPLVTSTTFCREGLTSVAPHAYSRVSNPTVAALENTLGELEGAPPAVCFGSGLAAETALFLALLQQGDHVVCGRSVYGGTTRLLDQILPGFGVRTTFVDTTDLAAVQNALRPGTRLVFLETPANPTLEVTDIERVAVLARAVGALVVVDNTFLTGVLQQPLDHGADVTVTSTTKYVDGHSSAVGGSVVSRDRELLERLRFIRKSTGGILSPFAAWTTLQGLKTLPLRLRRQSETAAAVAGWFAERTDIATVHYPGFRPGEAALTARQHLGAHGAVVSFALPDAETAQALIGHLQVPRLVEHVGSVETLVTHSASMTHADVPPETRRAAGVGDGLLRLSIGLEPPATLIEDLEQALDQVWDQVLSRTAASAGEEAPCPGR